MRKATNKDNYTKVEILGQYNTKIEGTDKIISELPVEITDKTVFIEPSFGSGNFVKSFRLLSLIDFKNKKIYKLIYGKKNFISRQCTSSS